MPRCWVAMFGYIPVCHQQATIVTVADDEAMWFTRNGTYHNIKNLPQTHTAMSESIMDQHIDSHRQFVFSEHS